MNSMKGAGFPSSSSGDNRNGVPKRLTKTVIYKSEKWQVLARLLGTLVPKTTPGVTWSIDGPVPLWPHTGDGVSAKSKLDYGGNYILRCGATAAQAPHLPRPQYH